MDEMKTIVPLPEDVRAGLADLRNADTTKLAYIGDAVYEVYIRMSSVAACGRKAIDMNRRSVHYVRADSQAKAAKGLLEGFYTPDEEVLFKRARNRTNTSHPRGSSPKVYKLATGFEAVIGWLYVSGETSRLKDMIDEAVKVIDKDRL